MIYVHIPFCRSFCSYCNFYSSTKLREITPVLDSIKQEWIRERDTWLDLWRSGTFRLRHTLYIGGGTPSVCQAGELAPILDLLGNDLKNEGMKPSEVTLEANPGDLSVAYCSALLALGVNRLSIGIQSFNDTHLQAMKRRHTAGEGINAVKAARTAGFRNISLDLIFGFPGLILSQWEETLQQAVALAPEHISAYQLSLESTSPWGKKGLLPPQEDCAAQYGFLQDFLAGRGYTQYEVSSFCLPGKESLHNIGYWLRIPYLGLGPAAHSFNGRDRYANVAHLGRYVQGIRTGTPARTYDRLVARNEHNEWIMLQLRTVEGFSLSGLQEREGTEAVERFLKQIAPLLERGLLELYSQHAQGKERVRIPPGRLFVSDDIIRDCLLPA